MIFRNLAIAAMVMSTNPVLAGGPCGTALPIEMPANCDGVAASHPFEGLENFRELTTSDGRIKPGVLFRSDQLDALTDSDVAMMSGMGIETIVDLRAPEELERHPNRQIPSVRQSVNLPIGSDPADVAKIMPLDVAARLRPMWFEGKFAEIDQLLADHDVDLPKIRIERYKDFARDFNPQISRYLHLLTEETSFPLIVHCAGGKDRTGFVAALTLLSLGYDRDDVMRDYLTTNVYTYGTLEALVGKGPHSLRPAFGAHPEQINAALDAIEADHGSFETYRRDVLGISDEELGKIRANLLN